ncbi:helix-turn-helix transcriptional regulator [Micromonospora sp. RTP1Z1]|uniref:helix-turn-helix domain-containing protein n=1 Tax=Micromonospora sp. RTP1Z1 TaxID=2994043 RepID=UPI0029C6D3EC|nr:helix-turn-helix transcriptional regulator [Micromonospora sp. RTP1Z1]
MTQDQTSGIASLISDVIGQRIRDLRERAGMSREDLAAAASEAGAPAGLTGTVIRFLETGRPGRDGQRTRYFTLDELAALAAGLEVTPMELLGDQAVLFVGQAGRPAACPTCAAGVGEMTRVVREDVDKLGELGELEPTLVATALRLAGAIDGATGEAAARLHLLTRELRATVEQLTAARRRDEPDDDDEDEFGDLDAPE